jgi:hypothetical protein
MGRFLFGDYLSMIYSGTDGRIMSGHDGTGKAASVSMLTPAGMISSLLRRQPDLDHVAAGPGRTGDFLNPPSISRISQGFADYSGELVISRV